MPGGRAGVTPLSVVYRRLTAESCVNSPDVVAYWPRAWLAEGSVLDGVALVRADGLADGLLSVRCSRIESRSSSAKRPAVATSPRAWSTFSLPRTVARSTAGHLDADASGAGGAGSLEPAPGPGADAHERSLLPSGAAASAGGCCSLRDGRGVVRVDDLWNTRSGELFASNPTRVDGVGTSCDGQSLADHSAPHLCAGMGVILRCCGRCLGCRLPWQPWSSGARWRRSTRSGWWSADGFSVRRESR